jgi:hypothetical protein
MRSRIRFAKAGVAALLGFAPAVAFAPAFGRTADEALTNPAYALPMLGAVAVAALVCLLLAAVIRLPPVTRLTAALGALVAFVVLMVPANLVDGPYRLLTSAPPVDPAGPELAVAVLLCGLVTIGAVEPALRRPAAGWSLLAPAVGLGIALTVAAPVRAVVWLAPAVVLAAVALLALSARERRLQTAARGGFRLLPPVALALLVGVAVVSGLTGPALLLLAGDPSPVDIRTLVEQPVEPRDGTSPLTQFPAFKTSKLVARLTVSSPRLPGRLRYATLDAFDGTYWTSTATYWRAGQRLPTGPESEDGPVVEERVQVDEGGALGWLLASGRPVEVSERGLGVDRVSGDLVVPAGRRLPAQYTVFSALTQHDRQLLVSDVPAPRTAEALPAAIVLHATRLAGGNSGYAALQRLADQFARDGGFGVDTSTRPAAGHGLFQIERLLESRRGTAEQFASAYAVLARALGYDTRVVVGFRTGEQLDGQRYRVTERDIDAWAEVRFATAGWVPFFPTPGAPGTERPPPEAPDDPADAPEPTPLPEYEPGTSGPSTLDAAGDLPPESSTLPLLWLVPVALAIALLAAGPVHRVRRRRRRRNAADPRQRVYGAWLDLLDRYAQAGLVWSPATTSGQVASAAGDRYPRLSQPTRSLAKLADAAGYAPAQLANGDADSAWAHADTVRAVLDSGVPWWRRWLAALRPRRLR